MAKIPANVESRVKETLKRYQPFVEQARARDIGKADTSTLVKDILADLFGYDKYSEITAEYQIRRELKRMSPDIRIEIEAIERVLSDEVIKREVLEGDKAVEARRRLSKAASKALRKAERDSTPPLVVPEGAIHHSHSNGSHHSDADSHSGGDSGGCDGGGGGSH